MRYDALKYLVLTAMLVGAGCAKNPLSTRPTEPPYGSGGTWETPQSPEVLVRNLLFAVNEQVISNYELCLSDSFVFSAVEDSVDAVNSGRPELFADWNKQVESAANANIFSVFSGSDTMSLFLSLASSPNHTDLIEDSTATLYREYIIRIITAHANSADTLAAQGLATFHVWAEQLNWWTIRWWEDTPASAGQFDWGDFKAAYRR